MNRSESELLLNQEKLVLELLKCNLTKKEISNKLNISIHSTNSYISKLEKLGLWQENFLK